jgi:alkyl hydroperoxide reductase subunit AhpC
MAGLKGEFDKRNTKIMGLSVDPVGDHERWAADIKAITGNDLNYPLIGDKDLKVSKLYGMLAADTGDSSEGRTAADNQTVRRGRQEEVSQRLGRTAPLYPLCGSTLKTH